MSQPVNKIASAFEAYKSSKNPAAGSPERALRDAFIQLENKVSPHFRAAASGLESIGNGILHEATSATVQQKHEAIAKIYEQLSKSNFLDLFFGNVSKISLAISEAAQIIGKTVNELLTNNKEGALRSTAEIVHKMTEMLQAHPLRMLLNLHEARKSIPVLAVNKSAAVSIPNTTMLA